MPIDGRSSKTPRLDPPPQRSDQTFGRSGASYSASGVPRGTIAPERLRVILQRLTAGHYDRADVLDRIAAGIGRG